MVYPLTAAWIKNIQYFTGPLAHLNIFCCIDYLRISGPLGQQNSCFKTQLMVAISHENSWVAERYLIFITGYGLSP